MEKDSTQYLFNYPRSRYEPEISYLAELRITDAKKLLKELSRRKDEIDINSPEMTALIERFQAVEKAIKHWEKVGYLK